MKRTHAHTHARTKRQEKSLTRDLLTHDNQTKVDKGMVLILELKPSQSLVYEDFISVFITPLR